MFRSTLLIIAVCTTNLSGTHDAAAQFPIKLPKITKSEKQAQVSSVPDSTEKRSSKPQIVVVNDGTPTIAKDSVQVTAFTLSSYRNNNAIWSWVPKIEYRVNGPIESGSQLYVEFNIPGNGPWLQFDCKTKPARAGLASKTECGGREIPEEKGIISIGPVKFAVKMRNELVGTDLTLFSGKMKVAKVPSNEEGPKAVNHFVYYVDHDWNLPIGMSSMKVTIDGIRMIQGVGPSLRSASRSGRGAKCQVLPSLIYSSAGKR